MSLNSFHEDTIADEESPNYPNFLLKIGDGRVPGTQGGYDKTMLPPSIELKNIIST